MTNDQTPRAAACDCVECRCERCACDSARRACGCGPA
jgi:hypothetical protein